MHWLGVDMGGTATRWVACDATGQPRARGVAPGASALENAVDRQKFNRVLSQIVSECPAKIQGAVLGLTGSGLAPGAAFVAESASVLGLPQDRVLILNDMVLAWHAVYPHGGGHLIAGGTGSVGLSISPSGQMTLVGGRGTLIDDAGSGAWIALQAVRRLWRIIDAHGAPVGAEVLAHHLFAAIGGTAWDDTQRAIYAGDRGKIGALATAVADAAQDGDPLALATMTRAGEELARLAHDLISRCGPAPVGLIGGVLALHPSIQAAFEAALPDVQPFYPSPDAAAYAASMALTHFPPEVP